jgi:hypothetical protein
MLMSTFIRLFLCATCTIVVVRSAENDLNAAKAVATKTLASLAPQSGPTAALAEGPGAELRTATLEEALPVSIVSLDALRKYEPGTDVNRLLQPLPKYVFPVATNGTIGSTIVVEKVGDSWKTAQVGGFRVAQGYSRVRSDNSKASRQDPKAYFAVEIPALNLQFVGRRVESKVRLAPLFTDESLDFVAGQEKPGEEIFTKLSAIAVNYNGLPR